MKPTMHLRFIERVIKTHIEPGGIEHGYKIKILQQWWAYDPDNYSDWIMKVNGQWRNIPLEVEE